MSIDIRGGKPLTEAMSIPTRFREQAQNFLAANDEAIRYYRSPARINIIGEHTDYNSGFVLPAATALYTWLAITPRADRTIKIHSCNLDQTESFSLDEFQVRSDVAWIDYVRGVAAVLGRNDIRLRGADIMLSGEIPLGGGLSSSASLELIVARAFTDLANETLPAPQLASMCQQAEHEFANVQCGIMDQYTVACAHEGYALLLDCRSLDAREVPIPTDIAFILTDSGVRHRLPDGDYNSRAAECVAALEKLRATGAAVASMRDVTPELLAGAEQSLGGILFRRCRHVVSENDRVHQAVRALEEDDIHRIGTLLTACHASLRDDYEVSCDEVDKLVETANGCDGVLGSRMVGGGFGGCVLSVASRTDAERAKTQIGERYARISGELPWQHIVEPAGGVTELESS